MLGIITVLAYFAMLVAFSAIKTKNVMSGVIASALGAMTILLTLGHFW